MSESFKLGDIIDLVGNVKQVTTLLDGGADVEQLKSTLTDLIEDRKALLKFMLALKRANAAATAISDAPLSFVGGLAPLSVEPTDPPEPAPIPRRARASGPGLKSPRSIVGKDKDDE